VAGPPLPRLGGLGSFDGVDEFEGVTGPAPEPAGDDPGPAGGGPGARRTAPGAGRREKPMLRRNKHSRSPDASFVSKNAGVHNNGDAHFSGKN